VPANIISAEQVYTELTSIKLITHVDPLRDLRYFCPDIRWLADFGEFLSVNKQPYIQEKRDCDDFAVWALQHANDALASSQKATNCGHTFGIAKLSLGISLREDETTATFFGLEGPVNHVANLVRCNDGVWYFFEPQSSKYEPINNFADDDFVYNVRVWL